MKKIIIGVLLCMAFLAGVFAFNTIQLVYPPIAQDSFQNNHWAQHWFTDGDQVGMRSLWLFNTTEIVYIDVYDDGKIIINGHGICLDTGESTTGEKC